MQLIDIGANLTHESFRHDLADVLARARDAGVAQLVVTGASLQGSRDALDLARAHPGMLFSPREAQLFAFERQLEFAAGCGKPLFLHQRDAHADFIACLDNMLDQSGRGRIGRAVVHCFTGEKGELFDYLDRDFFIGITGWICDERRGTHLRQLVKSIPADRLMLETDAPYLLPRTVKPQPSHRRNEPMYLAHICAEVARDRGEDVAVTAANATAAARVFFGLP
jgi:TatD DNase family protein